jgi:pimeloyl-ACP methyl ester carboxylesterase
MRIGTQHHPWIFTTILLGIGFTLCSCEKNNQYAVNYFYTQTEDGITLALRRYQPKQLSADKNPVILCHGFSYNLLFWDLHEKVSLPRYLAQKGYDVWSLSLRGSSPSSQPINSSLRRLTRFNLQPETLKSLQKGVREIQMQDWSVDDHIRYDVPAALRFVCEQTKTRKAHWIGHSMGGMVMFAFLGRRDNDQADLVKSFVAMATPMAIFHPLSDPFQFLLDAEPTLKIGSKVVGTSAPATLGSIFGDLNTPMDKLFFNSTNMDNEVLRALFHQAEEEMGSSQWKQLMNMVKQERFISLDQSTDYTANLGRVKVPVYLLSGSVDNMATPDAVRFAYRQIQSEDKQFRLFGKVNSQKYNYGHNDLVIGKHSQSEVYPTVLEWLADHSCRPYENELMLQPAPFDPKTNSTKAH